jgi:hypothetical protein
MGNRGKGKKIEEVVVGHGKGAKTKGSKRRSKGRR